MSGFKLIAIRPLEGNNPDILKKIKEGVLYRFYNEYKFINESGLEIKEGEREYEVSEIINVNPLPINLYLDKPNINISAIVGKNGSGKSSLLELLYGFCLCLSQNQIKMIDELERLRKTNKWEFIQNLFDTLSLEIFYQRNIQVEGTTKTEIRSIKYINGVETHFIFNSKREKYNYPFNLHQFCYSIAINYSLYGLNENFSPWLSPMFHKNDGYQAPLVINPYRIDGNIDINRENELANYRLIQNIVESKEKEYHIINGQKTNEILFSFEPKNLKTIHWNNKKIDINNEILKIESNIGKSIYDLFNSIIKKINVDRGLNFKEITKEQIGEFRSIRNTGIDQKVSEYYDGKNTNYGSFLHFCFIEYIFRKIFKILTLDIGRQSYLSGNDRNELIFDFTYVGIYRKILNIFKDRSHVTLKLRQMLFITDNSLFYTDWGISTDSDNKNYFAFNKRLKLNDLQSYFDSINEKADGLEFVPGGIFKPKVLINREIATYNNDKIELLSSGEQQFIFTIHTILYHLRNINSVDESGQNEKILYENINLIFDEIELCFHPEFQRVFIKNLIENIESLKIPKIKNINVIFSTHSPFILSDIPSQNILKLIDGEPQQYDENEQTFGANIHDLLANDFFLSDTTGEFVTSKVNSIINFYYKVCKADKDEILNLKKEFILSKPNFEFIINNIGEKVTKAILNNHFEFIKEKLG